MTDSSISVYFNPNDFENSKRVYGRTSANNSLLKAIVQYSKRSNISLYVEKSQFFDDFKNTYIEQLESSKKTFKPINCGDIPGLCQTGLYVHTDPILSEMSWARSFMGASSFSLCGLIHTLSNKVITEEIAKLILAPIHEWDALVCTSTAAKKVIENLFSQWFDYLNPNYRQPSSLKLQLPVIPLGINPEEFVANEDRDLNRRQFRERFNIAENDFVVLYFGRLFFYEKAHPIPAYLALEEIAKRSSGKNRVHFIQAGWFDNEKDLPHYEEAAKLFCPSVNVIFINDIDTESKKKAIWPGVDVFLSLSDNIQESFGITILEAMANKLPVVVSDWDGYKDTVRQGIDGFRIPTLLPPAGCGVDLSLGYLTKSINYQTYSALNSQMTAIDIASCIDALWQLYQSPELRQQMGQAGVQRVYDNYHWLKVMELYDALWNELAERRKKADINGQKPLTFPPMAPDPLLSFSSYASNTLDAKTLLNIGTTPLNQLALLDANYLGGFGKEQRLAMPFLENIIQQIMKGKKTVQQLVELAQAIDSSLQSGVIVRSISYLIKYNFVRLD
ncbi:MAG: glycosyltransferase family 4 protein [Proteobacteria bacterium]|nr:glycosyltransferase family 4 protein [Pseudomonadota bacterium]